MFVCWRLEATFYPPTCSCVVIDHLGTGIFGMFKHSKSSLGESDLWNLQLEPRLAFSSSTMWKLCPGHWMLRRQMVMGLDGVDAVLRLHLLFDWSSVTDGNRNTIFCAWSLGNRASWWNSSKNGLLRDSFLGAETGRHVLLDGFHPFRSIENNPCILH